MRESSNLKRVYTTLRTPPLTSFFLLNTPSTSRLASPSAVDALQGESCVGVAEAIMTTDRYPKVRRAEVAGKVAGEVAGGSVVGIAKGGGMIEPNMATMYVHVFRERRRRERTRANESTL